MTGMEFFVAIVLPITILLVVKGLLMLVEKQDRQD
jgi:hypothetical protein